MELTLDLLKAMRPCSDGLKWYIDNGEPPTVEDTIHTLLASSENEKIHWSNWLLSHTFSNRNCVMYAIYAASSVLHIFESEYPTDKRPRKAIAAAKHYLKCKNTNAAYAAAYAAYAAAYAANAAAYAANAAANAAAYAAANAAVYAAAYAANAAANAAAYAAYAAAAAYAADSRTGMKIIRYGIKLIKKQSNK